MRKAKNIFDGIAPRVLRGLLCNPGRTWTVRQISTEVEVSLGYTHAVLQTLFDLGYLSRNENNLIELVDPLRLLKRWASYNDYNQGNKFYDYYTFEKDIDDLFEKLKAVKDNYALTSLSGAYLVAPYVRPVVVEMYVEKESILTEIARAMHVKPIQREGNVRLVLPKDNGVFYKTQLRKDVIVVSDVQLFVDLFNNPGRGEEAAEKVLEVIQGNWAQSLIGGKVNV
jgi:hypothetical protein